MAVIVTGGTFGIGLSISLTLAAAGHDVVAFGLDAPQVSSIAANGTAIAQSQAAERGLTIDALDADVTDDGAVTRVVEHTLARFGRIDALVNNAAIGPLGTILTMSQATFAAVVDVNLGGTFRCCKAVIPHMIASGGGRIVNIGSGAGWGKPNMLAYSASKGGIFALSTALAYDHFRDHIRVNVVVPGGGGISSGMSLGRVGGDTGKLVSGAPGTVAGRYATGDDVANAVAFLLSPAADAISGTVIDVGCFAHQGGPIPKEREMKLHELKNEIETFFYFEAELLDERRFTEWLDLLSDDLTYFMPIHRNVKFGDRQREETRRGLDISWFDEDKWTLSKRVEQLNTGIHWAEEPASRVSHLVTNVQIHEVMPSLDTPHEVTAKSRFLIYQNRVELETSLFVGKRLDRLRRDGDSWKLVSREITLDQSVLQAKNLTVFF